MIRDGFDFPSSLIFFLPNNEFFGYDDGKLLKLQFKMKVNLWSMSLF